MINYTWFFDNFTVLTNLNNLEKVVCTIQWRFHGFNEEAVYATISGSTDVPPPGLNFVAFENLTHEIVESWMVWTLGEDTLNEFKSAIEAEIAEKIAPKKLILPAPWIDA